MTSKFATLQAAAALLGAAFLMSAPAAAQGWNNPHRGYAPAPMVRPHVMPAPHYGYGPPRHHRHWGWRHHGYGYGGPRGYGHGW